MVLGHHERVEADLVGVDRDLPDLVQQLLIRLVSRPMGRLALAFSSAAYPEPGICGFRKMENFTWETSFRGAYLCRQATLEIFAEQSLG